MKKVVKKAKKTVKKAVKKEDLANAIAVKLGMDEADATSLTKANVSALAMIVKALGD